MSDQDADRLEHGASHETDRLTDDQPPREDIIPVEELRELEDTEADPLISEDDAALPRPTADDLPESQGHDVSLGAKISEDYAERPRLSDEELGTDDFSAAADDLALDDGEQPGV
ncbi:hypothetical protein [Egicoccus halophilus]|uniref:DUF5709 domain-containing protein n=1 Tax=Egicoccus halophilus TaxID=1670830 RepID=A0A8J3ESE9_9ACTN|nr:hypothetical protein [Egicoccus halophilus]GGI03046.1 hypothetical protein GCM10011354_02430 [Egicoccus halophilus]